MSINKNLMAAAGIAALIAGVSVATHAVAQTVDDAQAVAPILTQDDGDVVAERGPGRFFNRGGGRRGGPGGPGGPGGFGQRGGPGGFGPGGPGGPDLAERFDANSDGQITAAEIDAARRNQIAEFDANSDGVLSLAEFESMWLERNRERLVDGFQRLDDDGNASVTLDELGPDSERLIARLDRNDDGVIDEDELRPPHRGPRGPRGPGGPAE